MPRMIFDLCKKHLPSFLEMDRSHALHTAEQLCEECISDEIVCHFFDGEDDECGSRGESIQFVNWLIDWLHKNGEPNFKPYNYDDFLKNVALDDVPRYYVSELFHCDWEKRTWSSFKLLNDGNPLSKKQYLAYIIKNVCGLRNGGQIYYNSIELDKDDRDVSLGKSAKRFYRILLKEPRIFLVAKKEILEKMGMMSETS